MSMRLVAVAQWVPSNRVQRGEQQPNYRQEPVAQFRLYLILKYESVGAWKKNENVKCDYEANDLKYLIG